MLFRGIAGVKTNNKLDFFFSYSMHVFVIYKGQTTLELVEKVREGQCSGTNWCNFYVAVSLG